MGKKATTQTAPATGVRSSGRIVKQPMRLRPSTPSEVPSELLELIHAAATGAASKSKLPFESDAVTALEEVMCLPVCRARPLIPAIAADIYHPRMSLYTGAGAHA
jgi:hypothetical protein